MTKMSYKIDEVFGKIVLQQHTYFWQNKDTVLALAFEAKPPLVFSFMDKPSTCGCKGVRERD